MATFASGSVVIPLPIEFVWACLREFTFPGKLLASQIESCELEGTTDPVQIGAVRRMKWKSGEVRRHRLLSISDYEFEVMWELIESEPAVEIYGKISTIKLRRVSENNHTWAEWSAEFGAGSAKDLITYECRAFEDNLIELRQNLLQTETLPILYHLSDGPSSRVVWLAAELGLPLNLKDANPVAAKSLKFSQTELPAHMGGFVTSYEDRNVKLLESGAIVTYLLEKHDLFYTLSPRPGSPLRAKYLQHFFYTNTADHLLMESYKYMFVGAKNEIQAQYSAGALKENKVLWDRNVAKIFEQDIAALGPFICGDFTAADIMVGYTLYLANLLGWLQDHPVLKQYYDRLSRRPAFQRAFGF